MPGGRTAIGGSPPQPVVEADGRMVVPPGLTAHIAPPAGDELVCEPIVDGIKVTVDRLTKVYVEATGLCNLHCSFCPREAWSASAGHMTEACYESLLVGIPDAARDSVTLAFGGFGEPTVHPDFVTMVEMARRAGRRVELITNGTTMTPELARDLGAAGVAQVTVSIDGGDDDVFRAIRGTGLPPVMDAVSLLLDHRRGARNRMTVGIACVATRRTVGSLPALITAAERLRADFVSISNVVPHTPGLADDALFTHVALVSDSRPDTWRPRLAVGRFDLDSVTRPLLDTLLRQLPVVPPPALDGGAWRNHCRFVREGVLAVSWDGRVTPCLSLMYTHTEHLGGHSRTVRAFDVGHVERSPLREIWRDPANRSFRARVREFDMSPCLTCGGCGISETNERDCFGTPFPACSECLWAQGIVLCP